MVTCRSSGGNSMTTMQEHYKKLSVNFKRLWNYSDAFVSSLTSDVIKLLALNAADTFVDLGCGPGLYTQEIYKQVGFSKPVICVDPVAEMLNILPSGSSFVKMNLNAQAFSQAGVHYDKVLIKEVIHHMKEDIEWVIPRLVANLSDIGRILVLLSPIEVNYPLFKKALTIRQRGVPLEGKINALFLESGLTSRIELRSYDVTLAKDTYFEMVRMRYMSFLSLFNDDEIEEGIREMDLALSNNTTVRFTESYYYIIGMK